MAFSGSPKKPAPADAPVHRVAACGWRTHGSSGRPSENKFSSDRRLAAAPLCLKGYPEMKDFLLVSGVGVALMVVGMICAHIATERTWRNMKASVRKEAEMIVREEFSRRLQKNTADMNAKLKHNPALDLTPDNQRR